MIGQSYESLQYIRYVVKATVNGNSSYNPTSDTVQFGFDSTPSSRGDVPPGSWVAGSWETDTISGQTAYVAKCLVGPGGTFVPAARTTYWVWIQITDNPEIPVMQVGQLQIV